MGQPDFVMIRPINEVSMRQRQSGFTLVEIMVVVVILAVLGALVVPKLIENVDRARVARAQSDIRAVQTALDLYRLDNFKYPTTEQGLQALVKQPNDPSITNYRAEGYLPALPKDPWNNPYQYASPGADGKPYEVLTFGRDGKPGGDGYDADISSTTLDAR
jgi:general secretion pathway protein G